MSQPPLSSQSQNPSNQHQQQPPNPYAFNNNIPSPPQHDNTNINTNTNTNNNNNLQRSNSTITVPIDPPVTPPTRPSMSDILASHGNSSINDDDRKSQHTTDGTSTGASVGGSTVITIHNLLQKTKLSPDDAAWLHSKIDQVTHDRYDGSLSYIGPSIPRSDNNNNGGLALSQSSIQPRNLEFDDTATEHSNRSNSNQIYSPLRTSYRINPIPPSSMPSSRYAPHPGNYHIPSSGHSGSNRLISIREERERDNNTSNTNIHRRNRRKRARHDVFNDPEQDDQLMMSQSQQRKRMRLGNKSNIVKRRAFKDNYLRPMYSYQAPKYNTSMTPQYKQRAASIDSIGRNGNFNTARKPDVQKKNDDKPSSIQPQIILDDEEKDNVDTTVNDKNDIDSIVKDKIDDKSKHGFSFNNTTANFTTTMTTTTTKDKDNFPRNKNGFGSKRFLLNKPSEEQSKESSHETSENTMNSENTDNSENKPLKRRRKSKTRSPLKDKSMKLANNINTTPIKTTKMNDDSDDDDDLKKKKNDSESPLKKSSNNSTPKSNKSNTPKSK